MHKGVGLQNDSYRCWHELHIFFQKQGYIWRSDTEPRSTRKGSLPPIPQVSLSPHLAANSFSMSLAKQTNKQKEKRKEQSKNKQKPKTTEKQPCSSCVDVLQYLLNNSLCSGSSPNFWPSTDPVAASPASSLASDPELDLCSVYNGVGSSLTHGRQVS